MHNPGCMCSECHLGLAAYSRNPVAFLNALDLLSPPPTRLKVVPVHETENTYYGDRPQPWQPKPPRHLRAA